jgi:Fuseless
MPGGTQNRPGPPSPTKRRMFFWLVQVLDALMSILILAPLVVAYWRGTFNLLEIYLLPQYPLISIGVSFEIALVGGVLFIYIQDVLRDYIHNVRSPISELMLKRVYCYVFGLVVVNHWRGISKKFLSRNHSNQVLPLWLHSNCCWLSLA